MKYKILVIDDDKSIRFIVSNFLKKEFDVYTEKSCMSGLAHLQNKSTPDVIILDLILPNESGYDFIKIIKQSNFFKSIPILVLSAKENSVEKVKCLKLGADDYIVKLFNSEELLLRTLSLFKRAKLI